MIKFRKCQIFMYFGLCLIKINCLFDFWKLFSLNSCFFIYVYLFFRKLYAIGGYNGITQLNSAECYDPKEDKWTIISPMNSHRSALNVVVIDGRLYALGGYDGERFLSSIEIYDHATDTWEVIGAKMPIGKSGAGVAVGIKPPS